MIWVGDSWSRWGLRLFRLAMRAMPPGFRNRFGEEMEDAFSDGLSRQGGSALKGARFIGRAYGNVILTGIAERIRPTYRPNQRRNDYQGPDGERTGVDVMTRLGFVWGEVRLALRSAFRRPGFSTVVVLTLALGIGANTAIFSVVNGVLLTPLPYENPEELLWVQSSWSGPEPGLGNMSSPDLADLGDLTAIEDLVGFGRRSMTLTGAGDPAVFSAATVTEGLMGVFEVVPQLGRDIRADEFAPDEPAVVVLNHGFWQSRLGGDSGVVGQTLNLSGVSYEVIGVGPPDFAFPSGVDFWIPRRLDLEGCGRGCHGMDAVGRLASGMSLAAAQAQAESLASRLEGEYRDTNLYKSFHLATLRDEVIGEVRVGLALMLGAVGLVLLIACANVATLLLVRGATRAAETSVRKALGASRARLVVGALVESALFAVVGGALGLLLAWGALQVLPDLAAGRIPRIADVALDGQVLLFTCVTLVLVTLLFGLIPALAGSTEGARASQRGQTDGRAQRRLRNWLLAGEVALCAVLLVGSGLLIRTFQELYSVDLGYETDGLVRFRLNLPQADYPTLDEVHLFFSSLEERIAALPNVSGAGSAWSAPLSSGSATGMLRVDGRPEPTVEEEREAAVHSVTAGWMEAMGISVIRGRGFTGADDFGGEPVALINEQLAQEHFADTDPIGQSISVTVDLGFGSPSFRVIGVIPNLRERSLTETATAGLWVPVGHYGPRALGVTVRSEPGAPPVLPAVRELVRSMDSALPMYRIETLSEAVSRQIAPTRFYVVLTAFFALLAAVLAAVGLYGVAAFAAARRTREIGLRVALGADRNGIVRLVIGQGMQPALWGLVVGLVLAYLGSGILESLLYGVRPADPIVFVLSGTMLAAVAGLAAALPARAAARTDPVVALRTE